MTTFDHEKLDVYQIALEFVVTAHDLVRSLPAGRGPLGDQLNRAASSVVLNIAEGAGEFSPAEKARFYRMARRSATECAGVLDVCRVLGIADGDGDRRRATDATPGGGDARPDGPGGGARRAG